MAQQVKDLAVVTAVAQVAIMAWVQSLAQELPYVVGAGPPNFFYLFIFICLFVFFLGPYPQHMEISRLEVEPEL